MNGFDDFFRQAVRGPRRNRLDFGDDQDQYPDPEIFYCPARLISLSVKYISS